MVAPTVDCVAIDNKIGLPFKNFFVSHALSYVNVTNLNKTDLPAIFVRLGILHVSTTQQAFWDNFKWFRAVFNVNLRR